MRKKAQVIGITFLHKNICNKIKWLLNQEFKWLNNELNIKTAESVDNSVEEVNTMYVKRGAAHDWAVDN
ncbi:hypothetical protein H0I68_16735 [Yersinia kristensenii]|uniref:hypothetical protein n=1 Tax=Yersinia kristensenii TaxID=28152 RepID=UPI001C60B93E|nr:hypothetical protein [Yersinia kristensenii]MBW5826689.1 hypothetical protein [Yersinia kristensenii]